jgi:hypothetical protein
MTSVGMFSARLQKRGNVLKAFLAFSSSSASLSRNNWGYTPLGPALSPVVVTARAMASTSWSRSNCARTGRCSSAPSGYASCSNFRSWSKAPVQEDWVSTSQIPPPVQSSSPACCPGHEKALRSCSSLKARKRASHSISISASLP